MVLLAQGNTILAKAQSRDSVQQYLQHRFPDAKINFLVDSQNPQVMRVVLASPGMMKTLELLKVGEWDKSEAILPSRKSKKDQRNGAPNSVGAKAG